MDFPKIDLDRRRINFHGRVYQWAARQFDPGWVIDVGSELGAGIKLMQAENSKLSIVGCDLSLSILRTATNFIWHANYRRVQADGARLPIATQALSGVCLMNILHLVDKPFNLAEETYRSLKHTGKVVVYVDLSKLPVRWEAGQFQQLLDDLLGSHFHLIELGDPSKIDSELFPIDSPPPGEFYLRLGKKR